MVYKPCPQCGKSNHHNKMKCGECGVCLRAKPGRPKVKREKTEVVSRPCTVLKIQDIILCPSCGHSNDLRETSKCTTCNHSLVSKGGKPHVMSTIPCPSCGHLNESKRASCSECEYALINKVGRPQPVKSTILCSSCGQIDCHEHIAKLSLLRNNQQY